MEIRNVNLEAKLIEVQEERDQERAKSGRRDMRQSDKSELRSVKKLYPETIDYQVSATLTANEHSTPSNVRRNPKPNPHPYP